MKEATYVDGMLVDWGASLFNLNPPKKAPQTASRAGASLIPRPPKGGAGMAREIGADAKEIRAKLGLLVKRAPEVMVKVSGAGRGMRQIKAHIDYISRDGQLEAEDQDGNPLKGKDDLSDLRGEWADGGFPLDDESERRDAFNIVLSMPKGTDALAVKRAARDFAMREFADHQYVMVLHTFETDPDPEPSEHPHVHLCVKAVALDGVRLNPRKADLQRWREGFARALREHGVEAAATTRTQRLQRQRAEKQAVRQMRDRGVRPTRIGLAPTDEGRVARARAIQSQVLKNYEGIVKALASSEKAEDRALANGVMNYLSQTLLQDQERDRVPDRGRSR